VLRRVLHAAVLTWAGVVLALSVVNLLAPQRDGVLALSQILAPFLFLPLLAGLSLWRTPGCAGQVLRGALVAAAVVFLGRFAPDWVSVPPAATAGAPTVEVTSWNLELGLADPATIVATLRDAPAGMVGLQELTVRHATAIEADPELAARFPYRAFEPRGGSTGIGLLSSLPFAGMPSALEDPPLVHVRVDAGGSEPLHAVVAHPLPAHIRQGPLGLPVGYDAGPRDADIAAVRDVVDPILAEGAPLLLFGDFNVVDREPGYAELTRGLTDAHAAVGLGPGLTWRPHSLEALPLGLLRIDLVLTAGAVAPLTISPDCTPRGSDHCLLRAVVELREGP
jgi:endonuclease/exonuclease/phosphatase family metal-dependent hydrolase